MGACADTFNRGSSHVRIYIQIGISAKFNVTLNGRAAHDDIYRILTKMAEYDLSKTIIPYLDRHLTFPILAHLAETELFPESEVQIAQFELAKGTNMFTYAASLFAQIHPDEEVPSGEQTSASADIHNETLDRVR